MVNTRELYIWNRNKKIKKVFSLHTMGVLRELYNFLVKIFYAWTNVDKANFIKPLCITLMFAGLRIGEALALKWKNIDFVNKTIKIERAITQTLKFDEQGNVKDRTTVIGDTKTACSVRDIPVLQPFAF